MTLSPEQLAAIRSDDETCIRDMDNHRVAGGYVDIGPSEFYPSTVRRLMRLGAIVVGSGVTVAELDNLATFADPLGLNDEDAKAIKMIVALAAEMDRAK